MFSKTTLAIFAALTATASVTALPAQYSDYADLVERDFYDNAELVERDYFDAVELAERDLFDMDFEELAARQDPNAAQVDPAAAQAGATVPPAQAGAAAPPTPVSSAPVPHHRGKGKGKHGHGHPGAHGPHGVHGAHSRHLGRHGHGHHGPVPPHHLNADGTRKSRSARRRANRKLRKQQAAAAAAQSQTAPSPQPGQADPSAAAGAPGMAPPVVAREVLLEERGLLETLGLKARVSSLSAKQTSKMNAAKTVCAGLSKKKDQKKCHKNVDKIIQLTKERNYDIEQFNKMAPGHESVFAPSAEPTTATHSASSLLSPAARY